MHLLSSPLSIYVKPIHARTQTLKHTSAHTSERYRENEIYTNFRVAEGEFWWPPAGLGKGMLDWLVKVRLV